jgi:hypothetical protein
MNNFTYMVPAPMAIALKNTVSRDVISGPEQETFIINIVNKALDKGIINVEVALNALGLDSVDASSASINNAKFEEIGAINASVEFISNSTFRAKVFMGITGSIFDDTDTYDAQINYSTIIKGDRFTVETNNIMSKSNTIGLGLENTASDNFMHGIYFQKKDNFSSQGSILLDKVGIFNLPYGIFLDDKTFAPITTTKKRFDGARTNLRCTYLSSDFTFLDKKNSDDEFTVSQKSIIDNLNSVDGLHSIYYANFECNNSIIHGGTLISGVGKDLELVVTASDNIESTYLICEAETGKIQFTKPFDFTLTDFNIESSGSIGLTTNRNLNALFSASRITFYRPIQIVNNSPISIMNAHLEFRDSLSNVIMKFSKKPDNFFDDRIEDITINFYTGKFIAQGRFGDVKIQADNYIILSGPYYNPGITETALNNKNNPTVKLENKENYAVSTNLPTSKTYLQSKFLESSSSVVFLFTDVCSTTQNDFIFSGYIIISSTEENNPSHLHLRLDGSFNNKDTVNPTVLTKTVIKRNILALESITFTELVNYTYDFGPSLSISLENSTVGQYNISIKLEIIAI